MYKQFRFLNEEFYNKMINFVLIFFTFASIFTIKYNLRILFVLVLSIICFFLILNVIQNKNIFKIDKIDIVILAYSFLVLVYFFNQNNNSIALKGLFAHFRWIIFFYIGKFSYIKLTKKNTEKIIRVILIIGVITAVYGIYQYYFDYYTLGSLLGNAKVLFKNHDATTFRPRQMYSIFLTPLTTAYMLTTSLITACISSFYNIKFGKRQKSIIYINVFIIGLLLFALLITYNRTTLISLIATSIIILIPLLFYYRKNVTKHINQNKFKFLLLALLCCILMVFIFKNTNMKYFLTVFKFNDAWSTSGHYMYLKKGLDFIIKYPLGLGLGVSTMDAGIMGLNTWNESNYFFISTEIGILGLVLYLVAICFIFSTTIKFYRKSVKIYNKSFSKIAICLLISFSISCITLPIFIAWVPTNFIFMILGLINFNSEIS